MVTHFYVGDRVSVRYGKHQGLVGTVLAAQPPDAYKVKVDHGPVLFFSGKGLALPENAPAPGARLR